MRRSLPVIATLVAVLFLAACTAPTVVTTPNPSVSAITSSPTAAPTPTPSPTPQPSAASGGVEVFATGQLHGAFVWLGDRDALRRAR